jgi:hypothetical protein
MGISNNAKTSARSQATMHYFVNSAIASSASTPPVIEIGEN